MLGLIGAAGATAALGVSCTVDDPWPHITALGNAYLAATPSENNTTILADALGGVNPTSTPPTLLAQLDASVIADFSSGQTVWLSGFLLSRTEARVAALWARQH